MKREVDGEAVVYVYDAMGQLAQEWGNSITATVGSNYVFADHLGSTRLEIPSDGLTASWWDYTPFGEEVPGTAGNRAGVSGFAYGGGKTSVMFTGQVRDWLANGDSTGLDYFGARYFSGAQGRFTSPDSPLVDQNVFDPQSWNLYSYGRNNPLVNTDPTGRSCVNDNNGKAVGDDSDGKGCSAVGVMSDEEAKKKGAATPAQGDPAVNVYGGPNAASQEVREAVADFLSGKGPTELEYSRDDPFTQSFQQSAGMDASMLESGVIAVKQPVSFRLARVRHSSTR